MANRQTRRLHIISERQPLLAVCERCNARFKSVLINVDDAEREVLRAFEVHDCDSNFQG
jgi:hypothetical protein